MKDSKKLYNSITNVNDEYIVETQNTNLKKKHHPWSRWIAMAACLCVILAVTLVIPSLLTTPAEPNEEDTQTAVIADYPLMVMIDGQVYIDTGETATNISGDSDGKIEFSVNGEPTENNHSNFGTGYSYQYGEDNTIRVNIDNEWRIFVPYQTKQDVDWNNLSEQEKEELDPTYNAN